MTVLEEHFKHLSEEIENNQARGDEVVGEFSN